jgi:uncharacterized membrane protein YhaH (DUF805 family)
VHLLFLLATFRGRISRKQWWIGLVMYALANLAGGFVLNPEYFTADEIPPANWPDTIWQLACLVPLTAITVKRGNDRNWPWWIGPTFAAANVFYLLAPFSGLEFGSGAPGASGVAFWILAIFALIIFIDNGFARGTPGPNRFGPDPLEAAGPKA